MIASKHVVDLLGSGSKYTKDFESNPNLEGIRIILLALSSGDDNFFENWVVNGSKHLIQVLKSTFSSMDDTRPIAVVVRNDASASAWEAAAGEATWQAARGIIQSITREKGAKEIRLNVICSNEESEKELNETLEFLATPRAAFFAGSSFDLRRNA